MGNSPNMVFRHYRELVTALDAKNWFKLQPKEKPLKEDEEESKEPAIKDAPDGRPLEP